MLIAVIAGGIDAIYFGAVGWPATVPDHLAWGSLLKFRREFDRCVKSAPGPCYLPRVPRRLAGRRPGDIDMLIVCEHTVGVYTSRGGRMLGGTERELVIQEPACTKAGATACCAMPSSRCTARHRTSTVSTSRTGSR